VTERPDERGRRRGPLAAAREAAGTLARDPTVRSLALLALLVAACAATTPALLDLELRDGRLFGPLVDVVHRSAPTLLVALGMTLVIGGGGVDLSVGSVMAIAATAAALAIRDHGAGTAAVLGVALAAGAAGGVLNAFLVAALRLQPIVATLILLTAGRGVAQLVSGGTVVAFDPAAVASVAGGAWLGLPKSAWIAAAALAGLTLVVRRTAYGLYLQALGDNPRAAYVAGLPVTAVVVATYVACSCLAALAGLLAAADVGAGDPSGTGLYVELDAILATVIGGTSLRGGKVRLAGTAAGVWMLQTLTTTVLMHGARLDLALVAKALAVLAVVAAQSPVVRRARWVRKDRKHEEVRT
jgi:ribose/xylose/arabinose/galactoside ABC-type transport system permease subunit